MKPIPHGGNAEATRRRLGLGDRPLIDASASLNPLGPPPAALEAARHALGRVDRYPEPGCPALVERLADRHGVPADRLIVGAGTTELIALIAQSLREVLALHAQAVGQPGAAMAHLIEPTYGEYRRACDLNELRVENWGEHVLGWAQDAFPADANGIFWTGHPANPTGRAWDRDDLLRRVDGTLGLLSVVDEAFLPFLADGPARTLTTDVATRDNLLVLRSLTKFYAMPGLRIGYAVASPDMVVRLGQYQEPWTVTAPAEAAALAALDDAEYAGRTLDLLDRERPRLLDRIWELPGLRPAWPDRSPPAGAPPLPNFVLVSLTSDTTWTAPEARDALARLGVLVRECSDFPGLEVGALLTGTDQLVATQGHLRIAVRTPAENDRIVDALAQVFRSEPPR